MNYSKIRFTLDIHRHMSRVSVPIMQGDTAVEMLISITDGGLPYVLNDGCEAYFVGRRPVDGKVLKHRCEIEQKNAVIKYVMEKETSEFAGTIPCEIRFVSENGSLTSPRFTLEVGECVVLPDEE